MNTVKVSKKQIKPILDVTFPDYTGRKFTVKFVERVTFWNTNWDGGSKNDYMAVKMTTGQVGQLPTFAPWVNPVEGQSIELTEDLVVVEHTFYCGQDLGITIYAHPSRSKVLTGA